MPFPFGGKFPQVTVNMDQNKMQSKGVSPSDVLDALQAQNVVAPVGTVKIGRLEYDIRNNAAATSLDEIGMMPIKQVNGAMIYIRDVASVSNGAEFQTNVVRQDGKRGVLISILKTGNASTLDVVSGILKLIPEIKLTIPKEVNIRPVNDQSIFVRAAVKGVIREIVIAACLTSLMILLFLGSWRSSIIIAISIPLSILSSVIVLGMIGETINIMTLGGLALAVGILVDDATVTIENIERFLENGYGLYDAILDGAAQISVPALVSTLCICIVFLPMFFLEGVSKYLFVPLAESVIFAMLASYVLSRTLVPTMALYLLRHKSHAPSRNPLVRVQRSFESRFEALRSSYQVLLTRLVVRRKLFVPAFLGVCICAFILVPFVGKDFFSNVDSGSFILHFRGQSGLRIEESARLADEIENQIRKSIPGNEIVGITDNIGLPYSPNNMMHLTNGMTGASDGDITVTLNENHHPTANYIRELRKQLPRLFPDAVLYFLPADQTTQILNFGMPAPIDIQFQGNDVAAASQQAAGMLDELRHVPGLTDIRIEQPQDYPTFKVNIDRTKAEQGGFTTRDVTQSMLDTLSSSFQTTPMWYFNTKNGVDTRWPCRPRSTT